MFLSASSGLTTLQTKASLRAIAEPPSTTTSFALEPGTAGDQGPDCAAIHSFTNPSSVASGKAPLSSTAL